MPKFYQIPFYRLCKVIAKNGGISGKGFFHLAPWLLKTTLLEPFRWVESIKYGKRIKCHSINQPPVFILGYYRSGTTYLQRMFMQDERFGYTSLFQTVLPEIMLTCERPMTKMLDKASSLFKLQNHFHRIPLQWDHFPGEEDVAMTAMLKPGASQWGMLFPKRSNAYFEKYVLMQDISESELKQWKDNYLLLLKKISIANKGKPLVLKNPPNTARIKVLLSLFPDAKFIHIARNPFEVFASTRRFWDVVKKNYALGSLRNVNTDQLILDSYARIMQQYMKQGILIPEKNLVEINYETFISQPEETMKCVYERLGLVDFEKCRAAMTNFANQQKTYPLLQHRLEEETEKNISKQWAPYINSWSEKNKPVSTIHNSYKISEMDLHK